MTNTLKIDHATHRLIMDRTFAKKSMDTRSEEFQHLQSVRAAYPNYQVERRQIKKKPNQEHYKGLTYDRMQSYICTHESGDMLKATLNHFDEMLQIAECHSRCHRYPTIKKWFLEKYPEVRDFGLIPREAVESAPENITPFPEIASDETEDVAAG